MVYLFDSNGSHCRGSLVVVWIAGKVILSIKRQYKKFEVEEEAYERAREEINKVFEKEKKDEK